MSLGTAAIENPGWTEKVIGKFADRITPDFDVCGETLAGRGWMTREPSLFGAIACSDVADCAHYVVTDVLHDGILSGPNPEPLARLCETTDATIVASGDVSSFQGIEATHGLVDAGVGGVIVGKTLYPGRLTLPGALDVVARTSVR